MQTKPHFYENFVIAGIFKKQSDVPIVWLNSDIATNFKITVNRVNIIRLVEPGNLITKIWHYISVILITFFCFCLFFLLKFIDVNIKAN